jgi:hypothetical protein
MPAFAGMTNYETGKPTAVILDIQEYQEMLEQLEDLEDLKMLKKLRKQPLKYRPLDERP